MKNDKISVMAPPSPKRLPNKAKFQAGSSPKWKRKLLENCYKRVREERTLLLWKMRTSAGKSLDEEEGMRSAFKDVVSDELKKINSSTLAAPSEGTALVDDNDMLWEYNGFHDALLGDCEEILLEMQRIFYEDIRCGENKQGNFTETWEDEEDEHLARAVFEHMNMNEREVTVTWCPICKRGEVVEDCKSIHCNSCELRLNKCDEVSLSKLRTRLAETFMEHCDEGCLNQPKFSVRTEFGLTALYVSCTDCGTFEVVI